jgi:hypothetical protein
MVLPLLGTLFESPLYQVAMVTEPVKLSVYVVEQVPFDRLQTDWLKLPPTLLVLQLTVPLGLDPDTVAVQVTGQPMETTLGEQETNVADFARRS